MDGGTGPLPSQEQPTGAGPGHLGLLNQTQLLLLLSLQAQHWIFLLNPKSLTRRNILQNLFVLLLFISSF